VKSLDCSEMPMEGFDSGSDAIYTRHSFFQRRHSPLRPFKHVSLGFGTAGTRIVAAAS
jgi:hypothetical protein